MQGWLGALALRCALGLSRGLRRPGVPASPRCYSAGELQGAEAPAHLGGRTGGFGGGIAALTRIPARSIDEDEDRYPRKLAFAECLCRGCVDVKTGRETTALNSVAIHQTMMVLRRKPCPGPGGHGLFTFEVDYIRVAVGCTCVLPRTDG
ncbi:PREDICTED: interleukin-17C [Tinamus guttatus]|uniref:interleukin-17C n=1 Tax=Tinamus guttatus TaxID=94827 RepID=UPI00052E87F8|nr:PREDICTED: interleukin-17C [Tinamus guttatus]